MRRLATGLLLAVAFGAPLAAALMLAVADPAGPGDALLGARRGGLLVQSALSAAGVAAVTTALAALAGLLSRVDGGRRLAAAALVTVLLPPYLHALAWMAAASALGRVLPGLATATSSALLAGFVQVMAYLPLAAAVALAGFAAIPAAPVEAALCLGPPWRAIMRVVLPLAAPALVAAACVVFLLAIGDPAVPTLFGLTPYALEVLSEYGASGSVAGAAWLGLPLLALAAVAGLGAAVAVRHAAARREPGAAGPWLPASPGTHALAAALALVLGLQLGVLGLAIAASVGSSAQLWRTLVEARAELLTSAVVVTGAALLSTGLALLVALGPGPRSRGWVALLLLLAVPPPILGVGLIATWNHPLTAALYGSLWMPVLASLARYGPLGVVVLLAFRAGLDRELLEATEVFGRTAWARARLQVALLRDGWLAAALVVGALSLGELGATLLVVPPGQSTLALRLYSYLHYGASPSVGGLALVVLTVGVGTAALLASRLARVARGI